MTVPERPPGAVASRPRRPPALPTMLAALACFGVVFEFLAFQLASGRDPALGESSATPAVSKPKPRRRIVITRVVAAGGRDSESTSGSGAAVVATPAPVSTSTS